MKGWLLGVALSIPTHRSSSSGVVACHGLQQQRKVGSGLGYASSVKRNGSTVPSTNPPVAAKDCAACTVLNASCGGRVSHNPVSDIALCGEQANALP